MSIVTKTKNPELYNALFEDSTIEDAKKVIQNMFNDITPEQFEKLKKQTIENIKQKQYNEYLTNNQLNDMYDRTIKLLNGANKDTYGFAPSEIQQLIKEIRNIKQLYNVEKNENRENKFRIRRAIEILSSSYCTCEDIIKVLKGEKK